MKQQNREVRSQNLRYRIEESGLRCLNENLIRIEPKIHKISLSSSNYRYENFLEFKPKIDEKYTLGNKNGYLHKCFLNHIPNSIKSMSLLFNPVIFLPKTGEMFRTGIYPQMMFIIVPKSIGYKPLDLLNLYEMFPDLKPSSVEYALDMFVTQHEDVNFTDFVYHTILKYLYVPYQRAVKHFEKVTIIGKTNALSYYLGEDTKLYQRGADHDKKNDLWASNDCDRIRLEFKIKSRMLRKYNLNSLQDIVVNSRFKELILDRDRIQFRKFKTFKRPPKKIVKLPIPGDYEFRNKTFQEVYIQLKNQVKHISQYTEKLDDTKLNGLISKINNSICSYRF